MSTCHWTKRLSTGRIRNQSVWLGTSPIASVAADNTPHSFQMFPGINAWIYERLRQSLSCSNRPAYRSPKERQQDTLARNEYTDLEASTEDSEDGENVPPCEASKTAIVVYGDGAGTTRKVCTDPNCPVHHPRRVTTIDPDAEARQREFEKEQAKRKRILKRRTESFNRILDNAPPTFSGPQLRVQAPRLDSHRSLRLHRRSVAAHFVGDDEKQPAGRRGGSDLRNGRNWTTTSSPAFALRLALTGHADVPP